MPHAAEDICTALIRVRAAFAKHNIPCPDILSYESQRKAYEGMRAVRMAIGPTIWAMDQDAKPYGECALAGFTIRFEAQMIERPGTGAELDDGLSGRIFMDRKPRGNDL